MLDDRERRLLRRLTREAAWLRRAKRTATAGEPVDFVAVQVLAAVALDASATFERVRARLGITKGQLSRSLGSLRSAHLIADPPGKHTRAVLPPVTDQGLAFLRELAQRLESR